MGKVFSSPEVLKLLPRNILSNFLFNLATGFIGKTLVEKLLWSCPGLENIFIIVRSKKGKNVQERVGDVTNSPCFDRIRASHPEYLKKIVALEGDITMENLGMSQEDLERFYEKVNVIFHSAASIRMDESVKDAINNNTIPTKRLIAMSKNIKNLDVSFDLNKSLEINFYLKRPSSTSRRLIQIIFNPTPKRFHICRHSIPTIW